MHRHAELVTSYGMKNSGRLRIGDDWNAINIIALSQQNPLKAVAEFVENSIDASARNTTITRGRDRASTFCASKTMARVFLGMRAIAISFTRLATKPLSCGMSAVCMQRNWC